MTGDLTVREAGRRGGLATSARHGPDHYRRLAAATNARLTPAQRTAIARLGWRAQQHALGPDGRARMARNGGRALAAWAAGTDYYARIRRPPAERTSRSTVSGVETVSRAKNGLQTTAGAW